MPAEGHTPTLRFRLLATLLVPLLGVAVLLGLTGAAIIANVVRASSDRVLAGALGAIAETVEVEGGDVTLDLPAAAFGMLENAERDSIFYRIAVGGTVLTGDEVLAGPPDPAAMQADQTQFRFARYRDRAIRVAEMRRDLPGVSEPVVIQIAETLDHRRAVRDRLVLALVVGEVALVGIAMILVGPALRWSLRPLAHLRRVVVARDTRAAPDLSPLDTGPLPVELRPLAEAFDHLLAQLDTATEGVRRFTADASHQMRTPLSVLRVQVALARRGDPDALNEIAEVADRLEHLVTQLLALARAEEAGVSPQLVEVDLREVAVAVINRRIGQALAANVEFDLQAPEAGLAVHAHRTLLFEIVSNLVDNAIRYGGAGGLVALRVSTIEAGEGPGGPAISIEDRGVGLAQADRERLGERFVRMGSSAGKDGSGLGFAIVRSAAQRIGAEVLVEDARPGLRVTIVFPRG